MAVAQVLHDLGFRIVATRGTKEAIQRMGIPALELNKIGDGSPNVVDWIESGEVDLVVNTPTGSGARTDGWEIRRAAVTRGIPCLTTLSARRWPRPGRSPACARGAPEVLSLQEVHRAERGAAATRPRPPRRLAGGPAPAPVAAGRRSAPTTSRARAPGAAGAAPALPALLRRASARGPARCASAASGSRAARAESALAAGFDKDALAVDAARRAGLRRRRGRDASRRRRSPATRGRASPACPPTARSSTAWASTTGGAAAAAARLARRRAAGPRRRRRRRREPRHGRRPSAEAEAAADYAAGARLVAPHADYVVVNVSSPNTPRPARPPGVAALRPLLVRGARGARRGGRRRAGCRCS